MSFVWVGRAIVVIVAGIAMIFLGVFLSLQHDTGYNTMSTTSIHNLKHGSTVKVYGTIIDSADHASPVLWDDTSGHHRYKDWFILNDTTGEVLVRTIGTVERSDTHMYNISEKVAVVGKVIINENGTRTIDAKAIASNTKDFFGTVNPQMLVCVQYSLFIVGPLLIIWGIFILHKVLKGTDPRYGGTGPIDNQPPTPTLPMSFPPTMNQWQPPPPPPGTQGPI